MAFFDTAWYVNYGDGSTTGYYAVPVWPGAAQVVTAGTWCRPSVTPAVGSERLWVCIIAGTTSGADPFSTVTRGFKQTDNTVTWQECTGMAGPCGDLTNAPVWVASRVITLGEVYYDSVSGSLQAATTAGTSKSGAAPSFSATAGVTTTDNTVTWTSLGPTSNYTTAFKYPHARLQNSFTATWGAANNQFAVADNHAETQSTAINLNITAASTPASICPVFCINHLTTLASPTLTTGAIVSTTGASNITIGSGQSFWYMYGITFSAGSGASTAIINLGTSVLVNFVLDTCTLQLNNTSTSSSIVGNSGNNVTLSYPLLLNCQIIFGATGQCIFGTNTTQNAYLIGGAIAATGSIPTTLMGTGLANKPMMVRMRDVDLSAITGILLQMGGIADGIVRLENCKLGAGVTITSGSPTTNSFYLSLVNCDSSSTNYRYYYATTTGSIQQETTIVRTGSLATNGVMPISWNLTTASSASYYLPLSSEEISQWNDLTGSVRTATFYLISNTTLKNNDFWIEVEYPSSSSNPLGATVSSKMVLLGAPVALSSDTSTWGGSTNQYTIALTFTPQAKGPIKARIYYAKASTTTYVDPYIYIT